MDQYRLLATALRRTTERDLRAGRPTRPGPPPPAPRRHHLLDHVR